MNAVDRYGFINAKLRARIGLMRDSGLTGSMLKAHTLGEAVNCLRETGFSPAAKVWDETGDLQQMGLLLLSSEIANYQEVASYLDPVLAAFVEELLGKIEEDNLKGALRLWYSSVVRMNPIRWRSAYLYKQKIVSGVDWVALINATDWKGVLQAVKGTPYEKVISAFSLEAVTKDGLFDLETAIDKAWYADLVQGAQRLPRSDRQIALALFTRDFDLKNILNLIRFGWYYKMEAKRLSSTLFPYGKVYGSKEAEAYIAQKADSRDPSAMVSRFCPEVGHLEVGSDSHSAVRMQNETMRLEAYLASEREKEYNALLSRNPFTIGVVLTYFYYYRRENARIRGILNGKYYGLSDDRIKEVIG